MYTYGGGMLTGSEIIKQVQAGKIEIDPFNEQFVNPNSYNLHLANEISVYDNLKNIYMPTGEFIRTMQKPMDIKKPVPELITTVLDEEGFVLQPNRLYLAHTVERTKSDYFIPMINGRSSLGRLGISAHVCAGFGDVGFNGTWTLEITAVEPVRIYPNIEIAQVCYFSPYGDTDIRYHGKYINQMDTTASLMNTDRSIIKE